MTYLRMKDGSLVNAAHVIAVRKREAIPERSLGPAVIVDFGIGSYGNLVVNECADEAEQEQLLRIYKSALMA